MSTDRRDLVALLGATCLFFATIEYLFPRPLPFLRLGLANLPILLALGMLRARDVLLVALLKVVGQGLLHGTVASYVFVFSLAGTVASTAVMIGAHRVGGRAISLVGVSLLGALASNVVQIALSLRFIFGPAAWPIAPVMLGTGSAGGILVGIVAQWFAARSRWYRTALSGRAGGAAGDHAAASDLPDPRNPPEDPLRRRRSMDRIAGSISPSLRLVAGGMALVLFVLQRQLVVKAVAAAAFGLLAVAAGKRIQWFYFAVLAASITFFNLLAPYGRVLLEIGPLAITEGGLAGGLIKAVTVVGLVFVSLAAVSRDLVLPGRFGAIVARTFATFDHLYRERKRVRRDHLVEDVDSILERAMTEPAPAAEAAGGRTTIAGALGAALLLATLAAALFVPA